MRKKFVYVSWGVWPLDGGAKLYSHGICREIEKIADLEIFTLEHSNMSDCDLACNIHAYDYNKLKNSLLFDFWGRVHAKMCGLIAVKKTMIDDINNYLQHNEVDFVIIDQISMYEFFWYLKKQGYSGRLIYVSHNAEIANYLESHKNRKVTIINSIKESIRGNLLKKAEVNILNNSDYVFSICKDDINWFKTNYACKNNLILCKPLIDFKQLKFDTSVFYHNIVFIGSMFWYPNVNGIIWFCENVFGELLQIDPSFKLYVVGKNPDSRLFKYKELFGESFVLTGFVDSIEPYYQMADIAIIPLFEGMGAKIKVLESIASGVPTIMTKLSADGYGITDEAIIADTKEEYLREILKLRDNPEYRNQKHITQLNFYKKYMVLDEEIRDILCK